MKPAPGINKQARPGVCKLIHHAQACVASPLGERFPAQLVDHPGHAASVLPAVIRIPGCTALHHLQLVDVCLGMGSHTADA